MNKDTNTSQLDGWKEIADFLSVTTRTAQQWEKEKGLPVKHRPGRRGRVYAYVEELEDWKRRQDDLSDTRYQARHVANPANDAIDMLQKSSSRPIFFWPLTVSLILLCAVLATVALKSLLPARGSTPTYRALTVIDTYDGPARPEGYWHMQAITYDGRNLWTSMNNAGWESILYKHNLDATLSIASSYRSPTLYVTGMAFVGGTLWTLDNYSDKLVKHGTDLISISARYAQNTSNTLHGLAFDGRNFWSFSSEFVYQYRNPPQANPSAYGVPFHPNEGAWDGNNLWTVDEEREVIRRHKMDPQLSVDAVCEIPAGVVDVGGICFANGYLWLVDIKRHKIYKCAIRG